VPSIADTQVAVRNPAWLAAPLAGVMFGASLIAFAAVRTDGYTHGTKAVSELGAVGAPSALAFNLLAFIVPGLLVAWFGVVLARCADNKVGPSLLAGSGLLVAMAGTFPFDLGNVAALTTIGHAIGVVGSGLLWVIALFWMGSLFSRHFGLSRWGRITPWFALFLFVHIAWQATFQITALVLPGYGQRIGFFGYFLWLAVSGMLLWSRGARSNTTGKAQLQ
jgi:hypothetical membrane protein